jgi:zinc/manganese transport system substrate-binding protein
MITRAIIFVAAFSGWGISQAASLNVVATSSSTGALVREVGGPGVALTILAPPDRDLHSLQAKPSMIRALRGADLLVLMGADLEVGWLPAAIQSAANPKVLPGQPGYFEAAAQVPLLDTHLPANRALGDVHPAGNPHINLDPLRMAQVALALAERLATLDPTGAETYRQRAQTFAREVDRRMPAWKRRLDQAPGAVLYHRDAVYLLDRFGVPLLGSLEPVPGVPPTAQQIRQLTDSLAGKPGVIAYPDYQPAQAPDALAQALGWPVFRLPLEPPLEAAGDGYLDHVDRWVGAVASGAR